MDIKDMWSDVQGKIWFKALISFIIVTVMMIWAACCFFPERTKDAPFTMRFIDFSWPQVILVLGGLGIVAASNYTNQKGNNENIQNTGPAPADARNGG